MDIDFCQMRGDEFFLEDLVETNGRKICKNCNSPFYLRMKFNNKLKNEEDSNN